MFRTEGAFVTLVLLACVRVGEGGQGGAGDQDDKCAEAGVAALGVK